MTKFYSIVTKFSTYAAHDLGRKVRKMVPIKCMACMQQLQYPLSKSCTVREISKMISENFEKYVGKLKKYYCNFWEFIWNIFQNFWKFPLENFKKCLEKFVEFK